MDLGLRLTFLINIHARGTKMPVKEDLFEFHTQQYLAAYHPCGYSSKYIYRLVVNLLRGVPLLRLRMPNPSFG